MITLLIVIAVAVAVLALFEEQLGRYKELILIVTGVILIAYCTMKPVGFDRDSTNYEYIFANADDPKYEMGIELSFLYLSQLLVAADAEIATLFFIYALLGVTLKLLSFRRMSTCVFLSLLIYLSNYFIIHEATQIRAGVASGLFLLGLSYQAEGRKGVTFLLFLVATLFHYSSFILFPLLLFRPFDLSRTGRYLLASVVPLSYVLYFLHINPMTTIPIPYVSDKLELYEKLTERGINGFDQINVFNMVFMVKLLILYYLLLFYDTVKQFDPHVSLWLIIQAISCSTFVAFATMPVISFRISELYGVVEILLIPAIAYTFRQQYVGKAIVVLIGLVILFINLFYNELFTPVAN